MAMGIRAQRFRLLFFFFSSRRRHTRSLRDWSSDVCSSDLVAGPRRSYELLTGVMGFEPFGESGFEARGDSRGGSIVFEPAEGRGFGGAGTIHHIAWASKMDDHDAWREKLLAAGLQATPVIDRYYFKSIY